MPYAEELRELGVDDTTLKEISSMTGGGAMADPADVFRKDRRPFRASVPIWPWIVALTALILLLEIFLRRVGPGIFAWMAQRRRERAARTV